MGLVAFLKPFSKCVCIEQCVIIRQPAQADDHRCGNPAVEEDVLLFDTLLCDVGEATEGEDNDEPVVQGELQGDDGDDDALCLAAALVPTPPWLPPPSKYIQASFQVWTKEPQEHAAADLEPFLKKKHAQIDSGLLSQKIRNQHYIAFYSDV